MSILAINKRANFDYTILEIYEAGLALFGHEVKSIKTKHVSLKESFVTIHGRELYLTNAHVPPYVHAGQINNYNPTRPRKLLVKKSEIKHLIGKARTQGLTLVPIKLYTKRCLVKLEFGLGKGKKEYDKREKIKKREDERNIKRTLKDF
ncbi:MAG TPA: SsrA-binding protein SmpB [Candidatus Moranbacteria bacterium]|nr:SsrA-binding protein SmpB [Candidatus Moranbacteria bacterium]